MKSRTKAAPVRTGVAPLLSVRRGAQAVEFYTAGVRRHGGLPHRGSLRRRWWRRLAVDGAEFWVADESPEHQNFSPESLGGGTVRMILTVSDPDAMFARAVAAGARVVTAMTNDLRVAPGPRGRPVRPPLGDRPAAEVTPVSIPPMGAAIARLSRAETCVTSSVSW